MPNGFSWDIEISEIRAKNPTSEHQLDGYGEPDEDKDVR